MYEGKEYPVYRLPVSSASHPFFTKSKQFIDSEGRVDKFMKKYKKKAIEPVETIEPKKEEDKGKKKSSKK